jgi:hypothetical protein
VAREIEDGCAFDIVEVIENAGLVSADYGVGLFVADVAAVASEVDLRIAAKDDVYFNA